MTRGSHFHPFCTCLDLEVSPRRFWRAGLGKRRLRGRRGGPWISLHAQIMGYQAALRLCALASAALLLRAFCIPTRKEFSNFDAAANRLPVFLRGWLGRP
jgi:hypothetical protein